MVKEFKDTQLAADDGGKWEGGRHKPADLGAGQGGLVGFLYCPKSKSSNFFF